jgi:uncharacterized protein DUF6883
VDEIRVVNASHSAASLGICDPRMIASAAMTLPNGRYAVVDIEKLSGYCLNLSHPRGRHKARVFASALGVTDAHAELLREALLLAAKTCEASPTERDEHGQRYVLDFEMIGPRGRARVRSSWIVRRDEDFPRLTSAYVL